MFTMIIHDHHDQDYNACDNHANSVGAKSLRQPVKNLMMMIIMIIRIMIITLIMMTLIMVTMMVM